MGNNYDTDYYDNTLRLNSGTSELISSIRWDWISYLKPKTVLDFGCGAGWFRAWKPEGVTCYSFDVARVPQSGIKLKMYDVTCFWDVLEHLKNPLALEPVFALSRAVAISVPMVPQADIWWSKHYKPGEHLWYFTEENLISLMSIFGFYIDKSGTPECPPRKDIQSFVFRK